MIWVVIHRGTDGNKQSNSLPCALEEALQLHWLFKCPHCVCVCVYKHILCVPVSLPWLCTLTTTCCCSQFPGLCQPSLPSNSGCFPDGKYLRLQVIKKSHSLKLKHKYVFVCMLAEGGVRVLPVGSSKSSSWSAWETFSTSPPFDRYCY